MPQTKGYPCLGFPILPRYRTKHYPFTACIERITRIIRRYWIHMKDYPFVSDSQDFTGLKNHFTETNIFLYRILPLYSRGLGVEPRRPRRPRPSTISILTVAGLNPIGRRPHHGLTRRPRFGPRPPRTSAPSTGAEPTSPSTSPSGAESLRPGRTTSPSSGAEPKRS